MKRIAVLMTCYNRVSTTLECLSRLFAQQLPPDISLDVWLVDDASPDNTGDIVHHRFSRVHVIKSEGGLFWTKGMRLAWDTAVKECDYDYYIWLNDDAMLKDIAVATIINDSQTANDSVIVGTFSSDEIESDISYGVTRERPNGMVPQIATKGMIGNFVLIPRSVYKKVGPICGRFYHQYGDWDYGVMLKDNGLGYYSSSIFCGYCPQQPERYLHLKGRSLLGRLKLLTSPKGFCVHDAFIFHLRHHGVLRALLSFAHIFLVVALALETKGRGEGK